MNEVLNQILNQVLNQSLGKVLKRGPKPDSKQGPKRGPLLKLAHRRWGEVRSQHYMYACLVLHAVQKYSAVHVLPDSFFSLTALLPVEDVSGGARTHLGAAHVHFRDGMCCPRSVCGYHPSFF